MKRSEVFHSDFKPEPFWWEAYKPAAGPQVDVPSQVRVAIVGSGYAGLACAIELADAGIESCVFEAGELGIGASTRNGGAVSGGVNIGKSFTGKSVELPPDQMQDMLSSASDAFGLVDNLIKREKNRMPLATRRSVRRGVDAD